MIRQGNDASAAVVPGPFQPEITAAPVPVIIVMYIDQGMRITNMIRQRVVTAFYPVVYINITVYYNIIITIYRGSGTVNCICAVNLAYGVSRPESRVCDTRGPV